MKEDDDIPVMPPKSRRDAKIKITERSKGKPIKENPDDDFFMYREKIEFEIYKLIESIIGKKCDSVISGDAELLSLIYHIQHNAPKIKPMENDPSKYMIVDYAPAIYELGVDDKNLAIIFIEYPNFIRRYERFKAQSILKNITKNKE